MANSGKDSEYLPREKILKSAFERDKYIIENADKFTVVRFLGSGKYERHEVWTLPEAKELATKLSTETKKAYGIYAVKGRSDAYVETVVVK
jgi:hypothetical protein